MIVDDHKEARERLCIALKKFSDIKVVSEAVDGMEAIRVVKRSRPDVVVMDINMPKMNGIDATASILKSHPQLPVIGFSFFLAGRLRAAMLEAGARMVLDKKIHVDALYAAIRSVVNRATVG